MHALAVVRDRDVRLPFREGGVEPRPESGVEERRVARHDEHELGGRGLEGARHAREGALEAVQPVRDDGVTVAGVALGAAVRVDGYRPRLPPHRGEDVLDHGPAGHLHQPLVGAAHPRAAPPGEDHSGYRFARIGANAHISPIFVASSNHSANFLASEGRLASVGGDW